MQTNYAAHRWAVLFIFGIIVLGFKLASIMAPPTEKWITIAQPTIGLTTLLQEQSDGTFLIEDEISEQDSAATKVIINFLDQTTDTIQLEDFKHLKNNQDPEVRQIYKGAYDGLFGFWLGRSMNNPIMPPAYIDQETYDRINKTTGAQMRVSAKNTTAKAPSGNTNYGRDSTRSTRSNGG